MISERDYTEDTLFDGRLNCLQHRKGYRFSVDAVLLGNFIRPRRGETILDLGCGCGIVSLILAYRWPSVNITALEIQPDLAVLARKNVKLNNWQERIKTVQGDLKEIKKYIAPGSFDWVVSNPPYRKPGTGRVNPGTEQAVARHEQAADLESVTRAANWAARKGGRACFIYPASRGAAVISGLKNTGLEPKKILPIFSYPGNAASLLIIEAVKQGGEELTLLSPFYIYEKKDGGYSPEMLRFYSP
ncbi:MAG: tRNA1(Val) (adenine(37)-N6)-methyltransferase [Deltaproteobacteria bacterium]|jgi:tRNA1(Val) A37 N6-methylase TrmN6|nr:tRNA1(Val) (adenine(37)-N6)-methyltransferase [Deltaproteobacteria bacterium]